MYQSNGFRIILAISAITLSHKLVSAAPQSSITASDYPTCADEGVDAALQKSGCQPSDIQCVCRSTEFIESVKQYAQDHCPTSEVQAVISYGETVCARAGIPLSIYPSNNNNNEYTIPPATITTSPTTTTTTSSESNTSTSPGTNVSWITLENFNATATKTATISPCPIISGTTCTCDSSMVTATIPSRYGNTTTTIQSEPINPNVVVKSTGDVATSTHTAVFTGGATRVGVGKGMGMTIPGFETGKLCMMTGLGIASMGFMAFLM